MGVLSSYPTYEEWKLLCLLAIPLQVGKNVLILPMRNGNFLYG